MKCRKIMIVGETNVSRSFLGETILRGILTARGAADITVCSRGLVVLFSEPVSLAALRVLKKHHYEIEAFRSAQLTKEDLQDVDLVLTVTAEQARTVQEQYLTEDSDTLCMFLGDYIGDKEDVPRLKDNTEEAYETCLLRVKDLMEKAADRILAEGD